MSHTSGPCDCYTDTFGEIRRCALHDAAQEMLEALKIAQHGLEAAFMGCPSVIAAIAKAEGRV